jgi:SAM-dependent methyltransferase
VTVYDQAAPFYDRWPWQRFWDRNEMPLVMAAIGAGPVLDLGTGTGRYVASFAQAGIAALGVDISEGMLGVATRKPDCAGFLARGDLRALPIRSSSVEAAVAARVLCHLPEIDLALSELARAVRPGGRLVVTELDPGHRFETTRIPTDGAPVEVETFKRGPATIVDSARRVGWVHVDIAQISATNCAWLPESGLSSIDRSGRRPVFFVVTLGRG